MPSPDIRLYRDIGQRIKSERCAAFAENVRPVVEEVRDQILAQGKRASYRAIAKRLNRLGIQAYRGGSWYAISVLRVLRGSASPGRTGGPEGG